MSFLDRWSGITDFGTAGSPFVNNPLNIGGQPQNLTGDAIPLGGLNPGLPPLGEDAANAQPSLPGTSSGASAATASGGISASGASNWLGLPADWFVRTMVFIVGAILLAVGLNMLRK